MNKSRAYAQSLMAPVLNFSNNRKYIQTPENFSVLWIGSIRLTCMRQKSIITNMQCKQGTMEEPYNMGRNCDLASQMGTIDSIKGRDTISIYLWGVRSFCPEKMRSIK